MKCVKCKAKIKGGQKVLPVHVYVENDKRGDFVSAPGMFVHLQCPEHAE